MRGGIKRAHVFVRRQRWGARGLGGRVYAHVLGKRAVHLGPLSPLLVLVGPAHRGQGDADAAVFNRLRVQLRCCQAAGSLILASRDKRVRTHHEILPASFLQKRPGASIKETDSAGFPHTAAEHINLISTSAVHGCCERAPLRSRTCFLCPGRTPCPCESPGNGVRPGIDSPSSSRSAALMRSVTRAGHAARSPAA